MDFQHTLSMLRGFCLSHVLYAAAEIGLMDRLGRGASRDELETLVEAERLTALIAYLENEDIVQSSGGDSPIYRLTDTGKAVHDQKGWLQLFVGGYTPVLSSLPALLTGVATDDRRNLAAVARGSGEISRFDAAPLAYSLMHSHLPACNRILDVGCGDAALLARVCEMSGSFGIGIDTSDDAIREARRTIAARGLSGQVQIMHGELFDVASTLPACDVILCAFVLQELLPKLGEIGLIRWSTRLGEKWPGAACIVIEVDHQPGAACLRTPFGLGYYNPYFLLHPLTRQRLLPREQWLRIFADAQYVVRATDTAPREIDPTGLEIGFLLSRS